MSETIMFEGIVLRNVHDWRTCQARNNPVCVIHNPTPHHMRLWPIGWRDDRGIFERICEHGIGHPDPDQFDYWREKGIQYEQAVHGCDGCCRPPFPGDIQEERVPRWSTWPGKSTGTVTTVGARGGSQWGAAPIAARIRSV